VITSVVVQVQPRAVRTEVTGWYGDAIRIRVAAPPTDNAANEALIRFLAERLRVPRAAVRLASGATARRKRIEVTGIDRPTALERLGVGPPPT
jgi:uncharacterized protein (TIGR00251 family)